MDDCHTFKLTSSDGTALYARHWPCATPRATLALVHGFGEHAARYQPLADYLTGKGIQIVALDLRGHGRSDGKRGVISSYDDFRADLAALLDRARQLHTDVSGPLILFGHSMGGGIVLDHGSRPDPGVDAIIASAPLIKIADPVPAPLAIIAKLIAKISTQAAMKQPIDGVKISTLPAEQTLYEEDALNHGHMGFKTALELISVGEALAEESTPRSVPTFIYHSDQDQLTDFSASEAFAQATGARFKRYTGVEHEMHNDTSRPTVFADISGFIDSVST